MTDKRQVTDAEAAVAAAKTYVEWQNEFPAGEPTVKITFEGLFCFFFDGMDDCFVSAATPTPRTPMTTRLRSCRKTAAPSPTS